MDWLTIARSTRAGDADETDDGRDLQAARAAEFEPEEGAEELPAVERVNRQHVEDEQHDIDDENLREKIRELWPRLRPPLCARQPKHAPEHGEEDHIYQRPGRDGPGFRPWARRDFGKSDAAEGPEDDLARLAADLARGQRVAELVHEHDDEQRDVFSDVPGERRVGGAAQANEIPGGEKPRPMEVNVDASEAEEPERARMSRRHRGEEGRKEGKKDTKNERVRCVCVRRFSRYRGRHEQSIRA